MQSLAYSLEEPTLKEMYLNLLATAVDDRRDDQCHPAFAEVVRQLKANEAEAVVEFIQARNTPVARFHAKKEGEDGKALILSHVVPYQRNGEIGFEDSSVTAMWLDNWSRLGLIAVSYTEWLVAKGSYDWVEKHPDYKVAEEEAARREHDLDVEHGVVKSTAFGRLFARAVTEDNIDATVTAEGDPGS